MKQMTSKVIARTGENREPLNSDINDDDVQLFDDVKLPNRCIAVMYLG